MFDEVGFIRWYAGDACRVDVFLPQQQRLIEQLDLSQLQEIDDIKHWHIILPSEYCLATQVELPSGLSKHKYPQAVANLLDEQLLTDIETNHYAFALLPEHQQLAVIVIARHVMADILEKCQAQHLKIHHIMPDYFLLPTPTATQWTLFCDQQRFIIRTSAYHGFSGALSNLKYYIQQYCHTQQIQLPETIQAYGDKPTVPLACHYQHHEDPQNLLKQIDEQWQQMPTINLCQGIFRPNENTKLTRINIALLIKTFLLLVSIGLASKFGQLLILHHKIHHQQQTIKKVYYQVFPHATSLTSPRLRMQQRLTGTNTTGKNTRLFMQINTLNAILARLPNLTVQHLSYQHKLLNLVLRASDMQIIERFIHLLKQHHINFKQHIHSQDQQISMSLTIIGNQHG